jgi:TolB-like protein/Tfp pilus assembly protein PilF
MPGALGRTAAQPSADECRMQLERILADPALQGSPRRRALLRHLVEQGLDGHADRLKGYAIALDVFGRSDGFDPQADPVVRLEARRLRRDLDGYYAGPGSGDPVRISIPKGGYAPLFEWRGPPEPTAAAAAEAVPRVAAPTGGVRGAPVAWLALAVVLLLAGAAGGWLWLRGGRATREAQVPAVIVLPFQALSAGDNDGFLAAGLTQELITDLLRFDGLRLYSPSPSTAGHDADPVALGQDLAVAYVVRGSLRSGAGSVRVGVQLVDATTGEVVWSETYDRPLTPEALLEVQADLASRMAAHLGEPYGAMTDAAANRLLGADVPSMASYACVLEAYVYRRTFGADLYAPALACLRAAVRRDPGYAQAWAMLGWLEMDAARFDFVAEAARPAAFERAFAAAGRAVDLEPSSVLALQALASISYYAGRFEESEALQRRALALNPNDPDTMAQLGWRLAARGNWGEGIPLLERAIERTVSPPGWYFNLITVRQYLDGDTAGAVASALRGLADDSGISWSLVAIAEAAAGHRAEARRALGEMAKRDPSLARDPAAAYRRHRATEEIVAPLVAGLRRAGWPEGM